MTLKRRVARLEEKTGAGDDWMDRSRHPAIRYIYDSKDGESGATVARAKAVTEWEVENGQRHGREPFFIEIALIEPKRSPRVDAISAPSITAD